MKCISHSSGLLVGQSLPVRVLAIIIASIILVAAVPTSAPIHVMVSDLIGMWVTVSGDCSQGQHLLGANRTYKVWCFDTVSDGEWSLRDGNKIVVKLDPKSADQEIITIVRIERYSDHTVLDLRYQNGTREKWTK
jgi:hypothetical protein